VSFITGPGFAPMWAYRLSVFGPLVGWVTLIPYFFYVVRFLDPSVIICRLRNEITTTLEAVASGKRRHDVAQDEIQDLLFQIGTIVIKAFDRGVAQEGVWALRQIIRAYGEVKPRMGDEWFLVGRSDFVGMSHHAIQMINQKRTWLGTYVHYQLVLCDRHALTKAPDEISTITNENRRIAVEAERRENRHVVSLSIRVFNTFVREALNTRQYGTIPHVFYQYRQLAGELGGDPRFARRVGAFFVVYSKLADDLECGFAADLASFDLEHVVETAYLQKAEAAEGRLNHFLSLPTLRSGRTSAARVRAKLIAAAFFAEQGLEVQLARVKRNLSEIPTADIASAAQHLVSIQKRAYWEMTDRAINIERTDKARRRRVRALAEELTAHGHHDEHHPHDERYEGHGLFADAHEVHDEHHAQDSGPLTTSRPSVLGAMVEDDDG
jgi:hypothetical protein